jgi:hypothetical protein
MTLDREPPFTSIKEKEERATLVLPVVGQWDAMTAICL